MEKGEVLEQIQDHEKTQKAYNQIGGALLLQILLSVTVSTIIMLLFSGIYEDVPWVASVSIFLSLMIGNTLPFIKPLKQIEGGFYSLFTRANYTAKTIVFALIICLFAKVCGGVLLAIIMALLELLGYQATTPDFSMNSSILSNVFMLLATIVVAPITEELIFRGVLLKTFEKQGTKFAIIATSAIWALVHGNLKQGIPVFFMGIALAIVTVKTKSIIPAIIIHGINNGFAQGLGYLGYRYPEYLVIFANGFLICIIIAFVILYVTNKEKLQFHQYIGIETNTSNYLFRSWTLILTVVIYLGMTALSLRLL